MSAGSNEAINGKLSGGMLSEPGIWAAENSDSVRLSMTRRFFSLFIADFSCLASMSSIEPGKKHPARTMPNNSPASSGKNNRVYRALNRIERSGINGYLYSVPCSSGRISAGSSFSPLLPGLSTGRGPRRYARAGFLRYICVPGDRPVFSCRGEVQV